MKGVLLRVMLLIALICCSQMAKAYDFVVNGIYYNILSAENKTIEVTYGESSRNTYSGDIVIPATVTNNGMMYNVTCVGKRAFAFCDALTSVILPESIDSLGDSSFRGCSLKSISLPSNCTAFGERAFQECEKLKSVNIPVGTRIISQMMFAMCSSLESIELPSTIEVIEPMGFSICTSLREIKWPPYLKSIGYESFDNVAFENLEIPEGITSIYEKTFSSCDNLKTVKFPSTLKSLGMNSFDFCTSLESIYIPKNLTSIAEDAFWRSGPLNTIQVDPENPVYDSRENCNAIICTNTNVLLKGGTLTKIPTDVVAIGNYALSGACFEEVVIPGHIKSIGRMAFDECEEVKSIILEEGVESVGEFIFEACKNLSFVSFPKTLNRFGQQPFRTSYAPKTIYEYSEVPPIVDLVNLKNYNENHNVDYVTVFVPFGSKEAYKNSESWGTFKIYEFGETITGDVNGDGHIDINDIPTLVNMVLGKEDCNYGDINGDGQLTISDISELVKMVLKNKTDK